MPCYDYECQNEKCKHVFEVTQKFSDEPIKECEKCKSEVKKLIGKSAVKFYGPGFYVNDYKKIKY